VSVLKNVATPLALVRLADPELGVEMMTWKVVAWTPPEDNYLRSPFGTSGADKIKIKNFQVEHDV
jgi:hypothetical protein